MMWLSWQTLRSRWQVFIGTFLALTFGVALMATTFLCIAGTQTATAQDDWLLSIAVTLLGNAAGVSGAAAIFVVAGTFAFAVAQRRREFALLRAIGATPGQIRRLVIGESLFIGIAATLAGCAIGIIGAPFFARWMASVELAPATFAPHITWWPLAIAGSVGLLSALLSAWLAARRASKVAPIEAFAEASIDRRTMTPIRWVSAAGFLIGAGLLTSLVIQKVHTGIGAAYALLEVLTLIFCITMLVPVFAPPLIRLLALPLRGISSSLAKANTTTSLRRTSSTIAPIFITMSLAAAAFSSVATLAGMQSQTAQERVKAPLVVAPQNSEDGLRPDAINAFTQAGAPATIEPVTKSAVLLTKDSPRSQDRLAALYVQPTIGEALNLPLTEGDITHLSASETIAVSQETATDHDWRVGDEIELWLPNSLHIQPKIVAIIRDVGGLGAKILLPASLQSRAQPELSAYLAYIVPGQGASPDAVARSLQPVAAQHHTQVIPTKEYLAQQDAQDSRVDQVALLTVVGLAILYTAISIANTCIMAITGRFRDFAVLQLSGATRAQILKMVVIETCLLTIVAAIAASVVTSVTLIIIQANAAAPQLVIPWGPVLTACAACLVIALGTSIVSTLWAFRTPAIRVAGARE